MLSRFSDMTECSKPLMSIILCLTTHSHVCCAFVQSQLALFCCGGLLFPLPRHSLQSPSDGQVYAQVIDAYSQVRP